MEEDFTRQPKIPFGRVSLVIMSGIKKCVSEELSRLGVRRIDPWSLEGISGAESSHADMSFCHTGGRRIFCAGNGDASAWRLLEEEGFELIKTCAPVSSAVPSLNVCIIGDKVLCDTKRTDKDLMSALEAEKYTLLHTNQRYARCSAAVIGKDALITADPSIYELCRNNLIDVLRISPGGIELDGYSYGFIGGCCGLLSPDILCFSGNAAMHPDYLNIKSFARDHGVSLLCLSDEPLYDIGGILPIKEHR